MIWSSLYMRARLGTSLKGQKKEEIRMLHSNRPSKTLLAVLIGIVVLVPMASLVWASPGVTLRGL